MDEKGVDEVTRRDNVFTDHGTNALRLSITTRSGALFDPYATVVVAGDGGRVAGGGIEGFVVEVVVDAVQGGVDGVHVSGSE